MIIEELKKERIAAIKARDKVTKTILTLVVGEAQRKQDESDEAVIKCIQSITKGINETLLHAGGECKGRLTKEREVISAFLPNKLTGKELDVLVSSKVLELGITDMRGMGQIMAYLKKSYSDFLIDGAEVKKVLMDATR